MPSRFWSELIRQPHTPESRGTAAAAAASEEPSALDLAAVLADQSCRRAATGHLTSERLEPSPRLALTIIHEFDCRIPRHGAGHNRRGVFPYRLVDVIFALIPTADRPFKTNGGHRPRADFGIAIRPSPLRGGMSSLYGRLIWSAVGFGLVEDTGDCGQGMVGRIALIQGFCLQVCGTAD